MGEWSVSKVLAGLFSLYREGTNHATLLNTQQVLTIDYFWHVCQRRVHFSVHLKSRTWNHCTSYINGLFHGYCQFKCHYCFSLWIKMMKPIQQLTKGPPVLQIYFCGNTNGKLSVNCNHTCYNESTLQWLNI